VRHIVIMAGGSGRRFWPLSRETYPKQFLTLFGDRSLLQCTYDRARRVVDRRRIWISTRAGLEAVIGEQIPRLDKYRMIVEPVGRDTAPSIALSCARIMREDREAVIMFLPADHFVSPESKFVKTSSRAFSVAEAADCIVTIGIMPTYPSTGYGYIHCDPRRTRKRMLAYFVSSFKEKPDLATAKRYLEEGNYYWNSGIFVAKASVMMKQLQKHSRRIFRLAEELLSSSRSAFQSRLKEAFHRMPKVSLDYAVMEKSTNVVMIPADFEWNDLGSWSSLGQLPNLRKKRNVSIGQALLLNSEGNITYSGRKLAVLIDVNDLVVATAGDAVLVCRKESAQKVKEAVDLLRKRYPSYT